MNNNEFIHSFYYATPGTHKSFNNLSYTIYNDNAKFSSYSTCIAKIITGLDGEKYTVLSDNNMSPTTSKHLSKLRQASPYPLLYLPQKYGDWYFEFATAKERLIKNLDYLLTVPMIRKEQRTDFENYYLMLVKYSEIIEKIPAKVINKYKSLLESFNSNGFVKKEKDRVKLEEAKRKRAAAKRFKELTKGKTYLQIIADTYGLQLGHNTMDFEGVRTIKSYLNPNNDLSFVWISGADVRTSQGLTFTIEEVKPLLAAYKAGVIKHGDIFREFTVLEVTPDFVKIGCHKIPVANINALIEVI